MDLIVNGCLQSSEQKLLEVRSDRRVAESDMEHDILENWWK